MHGVGAHPFSIFSILVPFFPFLFLRVRVCFFKAWHGYSGINGLRGRHEGMDRWSGQVGSGRVGYGGHDFSWLLGRAEGMGSSKKVSTCTVLYERRRANHASCCSLFQCAKAWVPRRECDSSATCRLSAGETGLGCQVQVTQCHKCTKIS
ncbi:hypothetical protein BS50DRAFT_174489 [Corynespora cassiicola Philippines]|uniref:Uncharacterized protein n=1 Tax=Corynespora cassiicola Philippines TaxID=1448308 RepID=A0A2T2P5K5_CORCC|nr:hypothetical protein BS50DRAFT_174489 [Corynespora cassiicola Philippines]